MFALLLAAGLSSTKAAVTNVKMKVKRRSAIAPSPCPTALVDGIPVCELVELTFTQENDAFASKLKLCRHAKTSKLGPTALAQYCKGETAFLNSALGVYKLVDKWAADCTSCHDFADPKRPIYQQTSETTLKAGIGKAKYLYFNKQYKQWVVSVSIRSSTGELKITATCVSSSAYLLRIYSVCSRIWVA